MMQLLLYQINWPAILDLESVGTGPSSYPILLPFRGNFFSVFNQAPVVQTLSSAIQRINHYPLDGYGGN